MKNWQITAAVITFSTVLGLGAAFQSELSLTDEYTEAQSDQPGESSDNSQEYALGSAHEHALFYVIINGSEKDFSSRRFQFNSRYVHLENNNSNIVHKHAEGVKWKQFLSTLNISINSTNQSSFCIDIYDKRNCGSGGVILNDMINPGLDKEISQGDNLVLVIGDNWRSKARSYMKKELPEDYKPQDSSGYRI